MTPRWLQNARWLFGIVFAAVVVGTLGSVAQAQSAQATPQSETIDDTPSYAPGEAILFFDDAAEAAKAVKITEQLQNPTSRLITLPQDTASAQEDELVSVLDNYVATEADVISEESDGQTIVAVEFAESGQTERFIESIDALPGVSAQPNYYYTLIDGPSEDATETLAPSEAPETDVFSKTSAMPISLTPLAMKALPNDPRLEDQYYLDPLGNGTSQSGANILAAWELLATAQRLTPTAVATIDTGVDLLHEDLASTVRLDLAYDAVSDKRIKDTASQNFTHITSSNGHGTSVAGIIAAAANNGLGIAGVGNGSQAITGSAEPLVQVVPVDIFGKNDKNTSTNYILKALGYLSDLIESHELTNLKVLNMSIGIYAEDSDAKVDEALHRAIAKITDQGVLCVAAGGNGDSKGNALNSAVYPSDFDECLSVTSLSPEGANSTFSDYNLAKDISAPGEKIVSTFAGGSHDKYFAEHTGTSFSAPIASGIAALLFAIDPSLTPQEAHGLITSTAAELPNKTINDRGDATGSAGALNAEAAVREALARIQSTAPGPSEEDPTTPAPLATCEVYRLYNPYTGEHLFTQDETEVAANVACGWNNEGKAWEAPVADGTPVYRLYNPYSTEHLYTKDAVEKGELLSSGWQDEGVAWCSASQETGVSIYRLYNPYAPEASSHHYTQDSNEYAELDLLGWKQEGVSWHGMA